MRSNDDRAPVTIADARLVFIAIGSNVGDRAGHLAAALRALAALPQSRLVRVSAIDDTAPIGPSDGRFLNQMVAVETSLDPEAMLDALQAIEADRGRVRHVRWGPRTLDLDMVAFEDGGAVHTARLSVPHPELPNREFWRRELHDLRRQLAHTPGEST